MDRAELTERVIRLRSLIKAHGVRVDVVLLFGSRARGENSPDSDYDLAFVSRDFGKDRLQEGVLLQKLAFGNLSNCDLIPVSLMEFLTPEPISPIVAEIRRDGITLI
jgi:predicted nucleotidyltransferase